MKKYVINDQIPIRLAAFPVGAMIKTRGWFGLIPSLIKILSDQYDTALITVDLPTPTIKYFD